MRILIIKLSSLGDLFHALPAVHNLKQGLGATVDWVTTKAYVDLVRCFDDVDNVIGFPRKQFLQNYRDFSTSLRAEQYDIIIDLQGLLKSAAVAWIAHGKRRIGPSFHREGSRLFYSSVAGARDRSRHAVIENLDIIDHLGLEKLPPTFPVTFPEYTTPSAHPRVAICPASRWESKNWPIERFIEVAKELQTRDQAAITLLGSPEDVDICRQIETKLDTPCLNLTGKTTLPEMGGVLKSMDLLIANDSGPVHMAAAVATPALAIFGPTDPKRCGPFGDGHRVLDTPYPCRPCHRRKCEQPDIPCITGVKVYHVLDAARDMLA
jgi:heptosyltransferase-1